MFTLQAVGLYAEQCAKLCTGENQMLTGYDLIVPLSATYS